MKLQSIKKNKTGEELEKTADSIEVKLKAGLTYSFCTCGASNKIPFCDDSHRQVNDVLSTLKCGVSNNRCL
ncbi:MAG: CDGSH iron-sulfur domain-containing protein, partial [Nanoarchaeota archaeon]